MWFREVAEGIIVKVIVQPRSSRNGIAGLHNDAVKIRLTAPPIEGAANKQCAEFLARSLKVPKSNVEIIHGHRSRAKKVLVRSVSREAVASLLKA